MTLGSTQVGSQPRNGQIQNRCLAALSAEASAFLKPHLKTVTLSAGDLLWDTGQPNRQTFFPGSGLISIVVPLQDGAAIEVGTVGCEGAAGGLEAAGATEVTTRGIVLMGGSFMQVASCTLWGLARQHREINDVLTNCSGWLATQAQQLAACNATHTAESRLCRWLTACQQRLGDERISATQELISALLGVRRTTVTLLAQRLHAQGLIDYSRGRISVRDPARLEAAACECCGSLGPARWPAGRHTATRRPPSNT